MESMMNSKCVKGSKFFYSINGYNDLLIQPILLRVDSFYRRGEMAVYNKTLHDREIVIILKNGKAKWRDWRMKTSAGMNSKKMAGIMIIFENFWGP